jgi:hypothetical protein
MSGIRTPIFLRFQLKIDNRNRWTGLGFHLRMGPFGLSPFPDERSSGADRKIEAGTFSISATLGIRPWAPQPDAG